MSYKLLIIMKIALIILATYLNIVFEKLKQK
jgi:hypothetical protein